MDLDRSTFGMPNPPVSIRLVIGQSAAHFHMERTDIFPTGASSTWTLDISANGHTVVQHGFPFITQLRAQWQGNVLVLDESVKFYDGTAGKLNLTYSLIEKGTTLLSQEMRQLGGSTVTNKLYFARK